MQIQKIDRKITLDRSILFIPYPHQQGISRGIVLKIEHRRRPESPVGVQVKQTVHTAH